ncbi:MAG: DUF4340 domain-containing protein [bacterium]
MLSKKSNKNLWIVFAALAVIVVILFFFDVGKNERSFREELVNVDTTAVTEILIYPKSMNHKEVRLYKENDKWHVKLDGQKSAAVPAGKISALFKQLVEIKPKKLTARGAGKWNEFQVDSTGTRLKVYEDGKETLSLIIGKFAFQQPRSMATNVRVDGDTDVYEVDGFLDMIFNQGPNYFRDNNVIKGEYNQWDKVSYIYPADSSFQLAKVFDKWSADGGNVDSAEVVNYFRQIYRLTSMNFVDNFDPKTFSGSTYRLLIAAKDSTIADVTAYVDPTWFVIHSSQNPEAYFDGNVNNLGSKIFIGKNKLTTKKQVSAK